MRIAKMIGVACTAGLFLVAGAAIGASTYPSKTIRLVVPFSPGGGTDILARLISKNVSEAWGQSIIIDNRGGAGGAIGIDIVAKSEPDGYTLLMMGNGITHLPALYRKLPYDTEKDLVPVMSLVMQPNMLVVHPGLPVKSVAQLIALAKSKPGEIRYGSGGRGSAPHLATEMFMAKANIKLTHVPYKGGGPAMIGLVAGELHMVIFGMASLLPHVRSGRMKALAVTGATRAQAMPDLPTVAEAGLPQYEFHSWYGLFAPANTPSDNIKKINEQFNRTLATKSLQEGLARRGTEPLGGTQQKFAAFVTAEIKNWTVVIREAKIHLD